jgi:hypothetical protein
VTDWTAVELTFTFPRKEDPIGIFLADSICNRFGTVPHTAITVALEANVYAAAALN